MTAQGTRGPRAEDEDEPDHAMRGRLRALRREPADRGFAAALHRRLVAAGPPPAPSFWERVRDRMARRPGLVWPAVGVAAGVATFLLLGVVTRGPDGGPAGSASRPAAVVAGPSTHRVPTTKVAFIKINFSSDVAVEDVSFDVALPEGLSFWSRGEMLADRSFGWSGPLRAGDNHIPVAVRATRPGIYRVKATALVGDRRIEHEVVLEVEEGA